MKPSSMQIFLFKEERLEVGYNTRFVFAAALEKVTKEKPTQSEHERSPIVSTVEREISLSFLRVTLHGF